MRIGWIGAGLMGAPMAARLAQAGHEIAVHNRTKTSAEPVLALGARWADSITDAAAGREVVVTMLPGPSDVEKAYLGPQGILANMAPGTIAIDMSTSSPALAQRLAEHPLLRPMNPDYHPALATVGEGTADAPVGGSPAFVSDAPVSGDRGLVLDAPVSGGPAGAQSGRLSIFVGGDADGYQRVRPLLEVLGTTIVHHGPAGSGQTAKLVNQALVANVTLGVCEAYALAAASGLDPALVLESLRVGVAGSALLDFAWSRLSAGDLEPGFKVAHLAKDLRLALDQAANLLSLPGAAQVLALCDQVTSTHGGDRGTQALITTTVLSGGTR